MSHALRLFLLAFLLSGLAACGKRGQLEPPPAARSEAAAPAGADAQSGRPGETRLGGKKRTPIAVPKRDLPIDWLLE